MLNSLSYKNCIRRPVRTLILAIISTTLCFSLLLGILVNLGLGNGLNSLETRLGADIMIIPDEAVAKEDFNNIILQGSPGYFYMPQEVAQKISGFEEVSDITDQLYLATLGSSCCSVKVQLIGYDNETDFVIKPWIYEGEDKKLGYMEVLVGNQINAFPGEKLTFYGVEVLVAGRLDKTGTYMDSSIYADNATIKELIATAERNKTFRFDNVDPEKVASCILLNVNEGYSVEDVIAKVNNEIEGVEAIKTQSIIAGIAQQLITIASLTKTMVVVIWLLILIIMFMAFSMITNERKKEFAVLRIMGVSRSKLFFIVLNENIMISFIGSFVGAILAICLSYMSSKVIEDSLGFPFLLPNFLMVLAIAFATFLASIITASLSAGIRAYKVSKTDPAIILRGDN